MEDFNLAREVAADVRSSEMFAEADAREELANLEQDEDFGPQDRLNDEAESGEDFDPRDLVPLTDEDFEDAESLDYGRDEFDEYACPEY